MGRKRGRHSQIPATEIIGVGQCSRRNCHPQTTTTPRLKTQPELLRVIFNEQEHQIDHPKVTCPRVDQRQDEGLFYIPIPIASVS